MEVIDQLIDRLTVKLAAIERRVARLEREDAATGDDPPGKVVPDSPSPRGRKASSARRSAPGHQDD
jgi:hypothetical protein